MFKKIHVRIIFLITLIMILLLFGLFVISNSFTERCVPKKELIKHTSMINNIAFDLSAKYNEYYSSGQISRDQDAILDRQIVKLVSEEKYPDREILVINKSGDVIFNTLLPEKTAMSIINLETKNKLLDDLINTGANDLEPKYISWEDKGSVLEEIVFRKSMCMQGWTLFYAFPKDYLQLQPYDIYWEMLVIVLFAFVMLIMFVYFISRNMYGLQSQFLHYIKDLTTDESGLSRQVKNELAHMASAEQSEIAVIIITYFGIEQSFRNKINNLNKKLKEKEFELSKQIAVVEKKSLHEESLEKELLKKDIDCKVLGKELKKEIKAKKLLEKAFLEKERKYRELYLEATDGIILHDKEGFILDANPAALEMLDYSLNEFIGLHPKELIHPEDIKLSAQKFREIVAGKTVRCELRFLMKFGEVINVEFTGKMISDNLIQLMLRDITSKKQLQDELMEAKSIAEASSSAKSEFLANISHELRTPLNGILGYTQILRKDKRLDQSHLEDLSIIEKSGQHLLHLINDILDLSKIEARRLELDTKEVSLRELVKSIKEMIRVRAEGKNLQFAYDYDEMLPEFVNTDEKKLKQILLNLLSNGVKYTETGSVSLYVKKLFSGRILFEVHDTGIGIPESELANIFEPFKRVPLQESNIIGTGLGLTICSKLVELMGGELHVESELGKGSRFWFDIELEEVKSIIDVTEEEEDTIPPGEMKSLDILVAEDNLINQKMITRMLTINNHKVTIAANGKEVLRALEEHDYDCILMDIFMPEMDGLEATQKIREKEEISKKHMPIVALTASALVGDKEAYLQAGMDDYISKPVNEGKLLRILNSIK